MNSSKKHWQKLQHDFNADLGQFIALNQDIFAELLTFIDFSEKFTLGFVEINFPPDSELLIEALKTDNQCEKIQFIILKFADPKLRFLRDEIIKELAKIEKEANKKLILIIQGLEKSIGVFGEYPPFLQDLNFVRDAYKKTVPYPILFILPDYAINRLAKFAPDFWAWRSGVFRFKTLEKTRENAITQTLESHIKIDRVEPQEKQERIEILQSLLMEYKPTGERTNYGNLRRYGNILLELGTAYISQHKPETAREYLRAALQNAEKLAAVNFKHQVLNKIGDAFAEEREFERAIDHYQQGLDIARKLKNRDYEGYALFNLGNACFNLRQFLEAKEYYQQCLEIAQELNDHRKQAGTYHQLGMVAQEMGEYAQARDYYQQALDIFIEFGERYHQASTYHNLGRVAQKMREYAQARDYYQQALAIYIEFGDRYSQASTYHNLGIVAQEMREYAQALDFYQQALAIKIEFGDRFFQASTYQQLGILAQEMREYAQALDFYQQALAIKIEFGDRYSQAKTYHCLGILAETQEDYTEARTNLQTALEIYIEYKDEYWGNITRENLERLPE
ncbi:tetratricopeptide repeat protein [Dolichospermum circinale]|uniref:tetratricopeptide repeat protein n=1 Tax=Dolichospermum circinale TaxID=109265 RepID=UPI00232C8A83|nr:tetratricopeptide repeat protein [Dolichospermum circinale]MDB9455340.1 tetratricopeptide repeat protein [Dolichospermum circinale CS-541/06]MDB9462727.1 tetratricopeptide repeat protein [Dolichospermum circinale CS-541/04]MDB9548693.1 tetratricopeptide repeat protein [Dolichospermum circinale CS-1031]